MPKEANSPFVFHMEDVLAVYCRPYDARYPQICLDEVGKALQAHKHEVLPMRAGQVERQDYEYQRQGSCSAFLAVEALAGKRFVQVRLRRTKRDWAQFMRELIEIHYPQAEKIVLVMDNLNTHTPACFYDVFEPAVAQRLAQKVEIHYTPLHGSWLNIAEIELSVLARQALSGRVPTLTEAQERVDAWQERRNRQNRTINWRFTAEDARIKLKRLYPSFEP